MCTRRQLLAVPFALDCGANSLLGFDHIAEAAHSARISHLARASPRLYVGADSLGRPGLSPCVDVGADRGFRLGKTVADGTSAERLLLPDRHADVAGPETGATRREVHDIARGIRTKSVVVNIEAAKRDLD
jgi:hypothetical protein